MDDATTSKISTPLGSGLHLFNDSVVCLNPFSINSKGLIFNDDLFHYSMPVLLLELSLMSLSTIGIHIILKPFGQISIVAQILGGIVLGPSVLGQNQTFAKVVFPREGMMLLNLFAMFGVIFFQFLVGVKMDLMMLLKSGKIVITTGILCYMLPFAMGTALANLLCSGFNMELSTRSSLNAIAFIHSQSSFHVITCFLRELKILNSELGRIATITSMLNTVLTWITKGINSIKDGEYESLEMSTKYAVSSAILIIISTYSMRQLALRAIRQTPEGKPVHESYIFATIMLILVCSFISQVIGHDFNAIPFLMGLVIPDGPPLGSTLEERFGSMITMLFLPIFFTVCGLRTNVFAIKNFKTVCLVELIIFISFLMKTVGTMLPLLVNKMPCQDAFSLALILNSKGIIELAEYTHEMVISHYFNLELYSIMVLNVVVISGVVSPLVRFLYDPSRRYLTYKRQTILDNGHESELGILACVHTQDNVLPIIKLLEASNPSKQSPIYVFVLHLIEMVGRNTPLFITHKRNAETKPTSSEHIIKAFRNYEQTSRGIISIDAFTSIAPFETMHDDICLLALEKRTSLVIIPFHKQWLTTGMTETSTAIRNLNSNVIAKAPCSVAILIDHHNLNLVSSAPMGKITSSLDDVGVLFFGGADDQEALAYAIRMTEQSNIKLTVIRFLSKDLISDNMSLRMLDNDIFNNFRLETLQNDRVWFQEEEVRDGAGIVNKIRSMENAYDLVMVGRRHEESSLTMGLTDWTEFPELGIIGDILAAPDFKGVPYILVVQQHVQVPSTPMHY